MNAQEQYRIGMFRDTGMTPNEIAKQLRHKQKTIENILAEIDAEKDKTNHFKRVRIVVAVWDGIFKRYISTEFEIEVNFKSLSYKEGVEKISNSIKEQIKPDLFI